MSGRLDQAQPSMCGHTGRVALAMAILMLAAVAPAWAGLHLRSSKASGLWASSHRRLQGRVECKVLNTTYHPSAIEVEWTANAHTYASSAWAGNETSTVGFCKHIDPATSDIKAGLALIHDLMAPNGRKNVMLSEMTYLSHFTYTVDCDGARHSHRVPIEPLIGSLRHPLYPCGDGVDGHWNTLFRKKKEEAPDPARHLLDKTYMLLASVYAAPWQYDKDMRVLVFDLGASVYNQGSGGASQQWFVETLLARGFRVDDYYAWEVGTYSGAQIFGVVPSWLLPRYRYYHIPAPTGWNDTANPLNILKEVAKPGDYVLFKLDVDNSEVEMALMDQLLNDTVAASLIDELFFEHHVRLNFMYPAWGGSPTSGTLQDSYDIFSRLRRMGIRAHAWV